MCHRKPDVVANHVIFSATSMQFQAAFSQGTVSVAQCRLPVCPQLCSVFLMACCLHALWPLGILLHAKISISARWHLNRFFGLSHGTFVQALAGAHTFPEIDTDVAPRPPRQRWSVRPHEEVRSTIRLLEVSPRYACQSPEK